MKLTNKIYYDIFKIKLEGEYMSESEIAGLICAMVITIFGIGFYIWLSIKVYNLQK